MPELNRSGYVGPLAGMLSPTAGSSVYSTVTASEQDMVLGAATGLYVFTCDIDCWIKQGTAPVASAAAGSMLVPAGLPMIIDGAQGLALSVLRKGAADGVATLQRLAIL